MTMIQSRPRTAADYGAAFAAALMVVTGCSSGASGLRSTSATGARQPRPLPRPAAGLPPAGALRPLRDPDPPEPYEDDDGSGQE